MIEKLLKQLVYSDSKEVVIIKFNGYQPMRLIQTKLKKAEVGKYKENK